MEKRWSFVLVSIFFTVMLIGASVMGLRTIRSLAALDGASNPGWGAGSANGEVRIVRVAEGGPAAEALLVGDRVIEINGERVRGLSHAATIFERMPPGSEYSIRIRREGREFEFRLRTEAISLSIVALLPLATLIIPAIFLFTGLALFILRPGDKLALLLALMFGASAGLFIGSPESTLPSWLRAVCYAAGLASTFFWPLFFHFFLLFPDPEGGLSPLLRRFKRLEFHLYLPHLLLTVPYVAYWSVFRAGREEGITPQSGEYGWIGYLVYGLAVCYIGGGLISLLVNYREASRLLRRKMRVVVAGSLGAILPMACLIAAELLFQERRMSESVLLWFALVAFSAFLLFPISFVYAIVRHQVIPVRLILRRGVRYLFVAQGSIVLELLTVSLVLTVLLDYLFRRWSLNRIWVVLISGLVAVLVWQAARYLHRRVIAPAIDRRFFRQSYNAQQILAELGETLRGMTDIREDVFARIIEQIRKALQADNVALLMRNEATGNYDCTVLSQHLGAENLTLLEASDLSIASDSFIIRHFAASSRPLRLDLDDPQSWGRALVAAERVERRGREQSGRVLAEMRAALLLPIAVKDELIGLLSLGPRLGDLPYSKEDEQLLVNVTWQFAYAIENARLVRRKAEEERLRREVEFATQVQKRLFPQSLPRIATLDLAGVCHPARGIGGDYYDFLQLGEARLGIAVADVSGKGLSAALLMSTVQASLRTQAKFAGGRITEMVASMNRLLCDSTDTSHYATFFYAEYEESGRRLTYVNAGHNPPLLVRPQALRQGTGSGALDAFAGEGREREVEVRVCPGVEEVRMLETGGPVIGLLRECEYEIETLELRRGDILLAYTDGVSEATNPDGEEFGERRLIEVVSGNTHLSADEICERIIQAVREWCGDAPLHDDLTLVVVRFV